MSNLLEPKDNSTRDTLRVIGFLCLIPGVIFAIVGVANFFISVGTFGEPRLFWCVFVGIPLIAIGSQCLKAGFLGAATKYIAEETTPNVADSAEAIAKSAGKGFWGGAQAKAKIEAPDAISRMKQLEEMKNSGLVSQEEYESKRKQILNEL